MSPEQKKRLEDARGNLYQVLVEEVEAPLPSMNTKEGRGDRVWLKKNAIGTANLIMRVEDLLGLRGAGAWAARKPADPDDEEGQPAAGAAESAGSSSDPDKLIAEAERKVLRLVGSKKPK